MNAFRTRKSKTNSTKHKNCYVIIYFKGGGAESLFRNIRDKRVKFRVFAANELVRYLIVHI